MTTATAKQAQVRPEGQRTPGPWRFGIAYESESGPIPFDYRSPGYYNNPGILGADGTTVVGCDEYYVFHSAADAAFIVRACNAHDELVAALRRYREVSHYILTHIDFRNLPEHLQRDAEQCDDQARAALKRAEE